MLKKLLTTVSLTCAFFTEGSTCGKTNSDVCLSWKIQRYHLIFTCKINCLENRVFFTSPNGEPLADCFPKAPREPQHCENFTETGSITQNIATNETIFTFTGRLDREVEGNWSCVHGTQPHSDNVEVTILAAKDALLEDYLTNRILRELIITVGSLIVGFVISAIGFCLSHKYRQLREYTIIAIIIVALVVPFSRLGVSAVPDEHHLKVSLAICIPGGVVSGLICGGLLFGAIRKVCCQVVDESQNTCDQDSDGSQNIRDQTRDGSQNNDADAPGQEVRVNLLEDGDAGGNVPPNDLNHNK